MRKERPKVRGVFERPKGSDIWWVRYTDQRGKLHREKMGAGTAGYKLACDVYNKRKVLIRENVYFPNVRAKKMTLAAAIDKYLPGVLAPLRPRSQASYAVYGRMWKKEFGDRAIDSITTTDLEEWQSKQVGRYRPASMEVVLAVIRNIYSRAHRDGVISIDPTQGLRKAKFDNRRTRELSLAEERRLKEVLPEADWLIVEFVLNTGMRISEFFGTRIEFVSWGDCTVLIPMSKSGKGRYIHMNKPASEALKRLFDLSGEFWPASTPEGRPWQPQYWTEKVFRPALEKAGIKDFRFHDLRHTFATRLARRRVPLQVIRDLLGHTTIVTTERYAHVLVDDVREAVNKLHPN